MALVIFFLAPLIIFLKIPRFYKQFTVLLESDDILKSLKNLVFKPDTSYGSSDDKSAETMSPVFALPSNELSESKEITTDIELKVCELIA